MSKFKIAIPPTAHQKGLTFEMKEVDGQDLSTHELLKEAFSPLFLKKAKLFIHLDHKEQKYWVVSSAVNGACITESDFFVTKDNAIKSAIAIIKNNGIRKFYKAIKIRFDGMGSVNK